MLETKYEMASNICEILRKIGCSGIRCGVWGTHFVLLPFTLQTSVKPYIIAGHLFISIKNLSLILGSFTDFEALFPLVSMDLQKLKKAWKAIRRNWSYLLMWEVAKKVV